MSQTGFPVKHKPWIGRTTSVEAGRETLTQEEKGRHWHKRDIAGFGRRGLEGNTGLKEVVSPEPHADLGKSRKGIYGRGRVGAKSSHCSRDPRPHHCECPRKLGGALASPASNPSIQWSSADPLPPQICSAGSMSGRWLFLGVWSNSAH